MLPIKDSRTLKLGMRMLVSSPRTTMQLTVLSRIGDTCFLKFFQQANRCISQLSMETSDTSLPITLLGPPEICLSSLLGKQKSEETVKQSTATVSNDPFINSMVSNFNDLCWPGPPPNRFMGFTENNSATYLSSGNQCLDFFFHVVPDTPATEVTRRLQSAWEQDPLTALKLVCNLRGVRGTGKSDREGFYASALWLHKNHPKTLASNTDSIQKFGYFKDLPEVLYRILNGADVRKSAAGLPRWRKCYLSREERRLAAATNGLERYNNDPVYQFLHNKISDVFAKHLKSDMENLSSGNLYKISLAAKWCPSLYSPYDNSTLLCESIARRLFPRDSYPEYEGIEEAHYSYRVRDRLRKEVLVPLRKALQIPEVYMSAKKWDLLPYNKVPSIAMKNYNDTFLAHDRERFRKFLGDVKQGEKKIAAGALLPHEIISSLRDGKDDKNEVAVLQWQRMVEDLSSIGKLSNCLAICDVSGSMFGLPLDVCIALGLLVSDLSEEPWKGKLITFSYNPQLQIIQGDDLRSKIECIVRLQWEMNTDFQKVFDKILEVAKKENITEDQMIKRLFVFSDMEFDQASARSWETDYEAITRKFHEAGFASVPEIVFWNLRNSSATPVPSHQKGVALVSGFSKNLLKLFLDSGGILNPEDSMVKAISGKEYQKLVVVD